MKMNAPYEGNEPYIFISYCHADKEQVYPLIRLMEENGYHVWYDQGINPGTDWPEVIADHLDRCRIFLAFISNASQESHNCRKEFNFAVMENKPSLCVLLEEVVFTPVMKMQMASIQAIRYDQCKSKWECLNKIMDMPDINLCREDEETVYVPREIVREFYLNRRKNSERIKLDKEEYKIGRNAACDYVISDNRTVSKVHAIFTVEGGNCYVTDNYSTNKIYVNDVKIQEGEPHLLADRDLIEVGSEKFILEITE